MSEDPGRQLFLKVLAQAEYLRKHWNELEPSQQQAVRAALGDVKPAHGPTPAELVALPALAAEAAQIGLWWYDPARQALMGDARCQRLLGAADEHTQPAAPLEPLLPKEAADQLQLAARRALSENITFDQMIETPLDDGVVHWVYLRGRPLQAQPGQVARLVGAALDMTERQAVEETLRQVMGRVQAQHYLMDDREQERHWIARQLHDGPLQNLIAVTFLLQDLLDRLETGPVAQEIAEVQTLLQEQVSSIYGVVTDLRPPTLLSFGLAKGIREHLQRVLRENPQLKIRFEEMQDARLTPEPVRQHMYRIFLEAVDNALQHGNPTFLEVVLHKDERMVSLEIRDDGPGFELSDDPVLLASQGHYGLVSIYERTDAMNGTVKIRTAPGEGTSVQVVVPIERYTRQAEPDE